MRAALVALAGESTHRLALLPALLLVVLVAACDFPDQSAFTTPVTQARPALTPSPAAAGTTAKVRRADLAASLKVRGQVVATDEHAVASRREGWVRSLSVKLGDQVEPGAVVAELEDPGLLDAIERARGDLATERAALAALQLPLSPGSSAETAALLRAAERSVEAAQLRLARLQAGPAPEEVKAAELALERARQALWSVQIERDGLCNPAYAVYQCEAARARVGGAELGVVAAQDALAALRRGPRAEDLALAEADVRAAEAGVEVARARHERELLEQRARAAGRELALRAKEAAVRRREAEVAGLEGRLAELRLLAPAAGNVVALDARVGDRVTPFLPLARIADPAKRELEASVAEEDVDWVVLGQEAQFTVDALPGERRAARVREIAGKPTLLQGRRFYQVRLAILDDGLGASRLRVGADVYFPVTKRQALVVPAQALLGDEVSRYVEVAGEGSARKVSVQVGLANAGEAEILAGLREGDSVVVRAAVR